MKFNYLIFKYKILNLNIFMKCSFIYIMIIFRNTFKKIWNIWIFWGEFLFDIFWINFGIKATFSYKKKKKKKKKKN